MKSKKLKINKKRKTGVIFLSTSKKRSKKTHLQIQKIANRILASLLIILLFLAFNKGALPNPLKMGAQKEPLAKTNVSDQKPAPSVTTPSPTASPSPASKKTFSSLVETSQAKETATNDFCLNIPILLYHHIQPYETAKKAGQTGLTVDSKIFEEQMAYLNSNGYKTINADQLAQALINRQQLPPKTILITIDDGYSDVYTYAFPIARQYSVVLNLMIPTGLLEGQDYLSWGQLKEMVSSGLAFAYDHTWSHVSLDSASKEKMQFEVLTSKKQLEDNLGKPVDIFTYPYGSTNSTAEEFLSTNGFIAAFSTISGFTQCNSFIMALHRNHIGNSPLSAYGL